jgi:hypothetical protein
MNSSGPISLGGATTGQSINLEIGSPATSTVSLNDTLVRTLAGVVSGQIVVPTDFYGKSISNAYFQVFTSPSIATGFGDFLSFDPAGNYFVRGTNVDVFCDSTGNITSSKIYNAVPAPVAASNYWNVKRINYVSEINSNNLIMAGDSIVTNLPTSTRNRASIGVFTNSTNTFVSKTWIYNGQNPNPGSANTQARMISAKDFPNGNIVGYYGSSGPEGAGGIVTFNSSLSQLSFQGVPGASSSSQISGTGIIKKASPTVSWVDFASRPIPTGIQTYTTVFLNSSTGAVTNVWQYNPAATGGGGTNGVTYSPTTSVIMNSGPGSPNKVVVGMVNNSPLSYTNQKQFSNAGGVPVGVTARISQSDNFSTSNKVAVCVSYGTGTPAGTIPYLIDIDNTLTVNNRWTLTCNGSVATLRINHIVFKDGFCYLTGSFNAYTFILKIPEDFSTIAGGLTATAGGLTFTLTPSADPGYLNLVPASLSISAGSLSPLTSTVTGTPNDFTYTSGAVTSNKVTV